MLNTFGEKSTEVAEELETPEFYESTMCILPKVKEEIACTCFDGKNCDVKIDDGGNLVCRYGSNEGMVDGVASVICPLEIESERKKWEKFLEEENKP